MKKHWVLLVFFLVMTSCLGPVETVNENKQLYGSEWSTEDESQGLKFFDDDSVLFFWTYGRGSGMFQYESRTGYIALKNLSMTVDGKTSEFDAAQVLEDGTMKLYWHYLGESKSYYMILIRRR